MDFTQTWHFQIIRHLQKYSCVQNILIKQVVVVGGGGWHGLIKKVSSFLYNPIVNSKILSIFQRRLILSY